VLSDQGNHVTGAFGLVFALSEEMQQTYLHLGLNVPEANGDNSWELPVPATYVVDRKRNIRFAHVDVNHTARAEPEEVLSVLRECVD
jgi:peroxiredoxin